MITFFPFPYPVSTPLGEGYAIYVTSQPMWENDTWACQLDDGRILHFSTNQLRGVVNGTYGIAPGAQTRPGLPRPSDLPESQRPTPPERPFARSPLHYAPAVWFDQAQARGRKLEAVCGAVAGPENRTGSDAAVITCSVCYDITARPGWRE